MSTAETPRPPFPPFDADSAAKKVRMAEDAWNTRDPERVSLAYTPDSTWRNRAEFLAGREAIKQFLVRKWSRELDYRLIKELWAFHGNRIAVRFAYEWHDDAGNWFRSYGNENWEFDEHGFMRRRIASINDLPIQAATESFTGPRAVAPMSIRPCRSWACDGTPLHNPARHTEIAVVAMLAVGGRSGIRRSERPNLRRSIPSWSRPTGSPSCSIIRR